jgi:DNA repair protein RecN (Recombination protein N)
MLRLRREVRAAGRARSFVGAQLSSAGVLAAICRNLIELQSQHQQVALVQPSEHGKVLDACGVNPGTSEAYRERRRVFLERMRAVDEYRQRQERLREQRDLVEYQLRELEQARLTGDELEPLRERVAILGGGARLMEAAASARDALADETLGAHGAVQRALRHLRTIQEDVTVLGEATDALDAAAELIGETERALDLFLSDAEYDPAQLAQAQQRLAELEDLCRKYGRTESELVRLRDRLAREVGELDLGDELPAHLAQPLEEARAELQASAAKLRRERKRVARRVSEEAARLLDALAMRGAAVRFDLPLRAEPEGVLRLEGRSVDAGPRGAEDVELFVRTNPGESFERIDRIASGGELSRLGLVLRTLSMERRRPAILILDEVDAGLGADTGPALAQRLRAMAQDTQLLVITHLPAVAAAADEHLAASKGAAGGRTLGRVERLDHDGRVAELTRMLGGPGEGHRRLAVKLLSPPGRPAAREERAR